MRRSTVFRLVGAVLVIGIGAYSVLWWIAAGKIEKAASAWRENARAQKLDAAWQGLHVAGYPLALRLDLTGVTLKDGASNPPAELQAPALSASVRPWNLHAVNFVAPAGLTAAFGPDGAPLVKIEAKSATGAAAPNGDGGATVWLSFYDAKATAGVTLAARAVHAWATLPAGAAAAQAGGGLALAIEARALTLPQAPPGLSPTIDDVGFGVTLQGAFPSGPLRQAAAAWRDSGGTLDLDHLDLRWGDMRINGSGTLALDSSLQPVGGFSGGVSGFDELLNALVAAGRIKASDARIARIALAMLAKTGPDGRPEIASSLTIQNGQMFLGPAKLGPAPHIDW
ncbi:MAG TPA: DUF2125 domain-containing protein [Stellaceae bacterium]|jgi:hypothetical protein|nr:DUF2125 domain-containing protein [Stellaceae bacterium]